MRIKLNYIASGAKPMAVVYESFDRVTLRWQFRRSVLASS
jgi:hypothetical protein